MRLQTDEAARIAALRETMRIRRRQPLAAPAVTNPKQNHSRCCTKALGLPHPLRQVCGAFNPSPAAARSAGCPTRLRFHPTTPENFAASVQLAKIPAARAGPCPSPPCLGEVSGPPSFATEPPHPRQHSPPAAVIGGRARRRPSNLCHHPHERRQPVPHACRRPPLPHSRRNRRELFVFNLAPLSPHRLRAPRHRGNLARPVLPGSRAPRPAHAQPPRRHVACLRTASLRACSARRPSTGIDLAAFLASSHPRSRACRRAQPRPIPLGAPLSSRPLLPPSGRPCRPSPRSQPQPRFRSQCGASLRRACLFSPALRPRLPPRLFAPPCSFSADGKAQLDIVLRLAGLMLHRSNIRPRFIKCIQAFTAGIGNGPGATLAKASPLTTPSRTAATSRRSPAPTRTSWKTTCSIS